MGRGRIKHPILAITIALAGLALASPPKAMDPPPLPVAMPEIPPKAIPVDPGRTDDASLHGFRSVGTFLIRSRMKITGNKVTRIPIKPMEIEVFTNGVEVKIVAGGRLDESSVFEIYRSDGIGRLNKHTGVLEVVPGLQASCRRDGILRHVRVTRDSLTITEFAAISDQTMVTHALAAKPKPPRPGRGTTTAGS
jgi:hypothetical protein